jgi:nucleoside-diphosphate-sugar epimerase
MVVYKSVKKVRGKKVLVTGAPGWLGNQLVQDMVDSGYDVKCLVLKGVDDSHLRSLGVKIVYGNILEPRTLKKAVKDVTSVIHGVGVVHVKFWSKDFFRINYEGTVNLFRAAKRAGVKRFVYVSSNGAGGKNVRRDILMSEEHEPRPVSDYGWSKLRSEEYLFKNKGEVEIVVMRLCWFYGKGQPVRTNTFMKMIKTGFPVMFGNGKNLRSLTHISNASQALILAEQVKQAANQVFWISDGEPYTLDEVYKAMAEALGVKARIIHFPYLCAWFSEVADKMLNKIGVHLPIIHIGAEMGMNIACDISKARSVLSYSPERDIIRGMKESVEKTDLA